MSIHHGLRIKVLMGGVSREREISLKTGRAVTKALGAAGYDASAFVVDNEALAGITHGNTDLAFIALHGRFGEDGGVQTVLEKRNIPYTGSGPKASSIAMNKVKSKDIFISANVPTASFFVIPRKTEHAPGRVKTAIGLPCVIKPAREGSSIGVEVVKDEAALEGAIVTALEMNTEAIAEKYVPGREMTCGILGDEALPLVELKPAREFFDYTAKYSAKGGTEITLDTGLDPKLTEKIQDYALKAHRALGLEGISRLDLILGKDNVPCFLEANTIPGMTEMSLFPAAAAAAGYDFGAMCGKIVDLALVKK